jgi:hypothetical protein
MKNTGINSLQIGVLYSEKNLLDNLRSTNCNTAKNDFEEMTSFLFSLLAPGVVALSLVLF